MKKKNCNHHATTVAAAVGPAGQWKLPESLPCETYNVDSETAVLRRDKQNVHVVHKLNNETSSNLKQKSVNIAEVNWLGLSGLSFIAAPIIKHFALKSCSFAS